jgi:hypothetical protein
MAKSVAQQKLKELNKLYTETQTLATQYGLNNYGSPVYKALENALSVMRDQALELNQIIKPRVDI